MEQESYELTTALFHIAPQALEKSQKYMLPKGASRSTAPLTERTPGMLTPRAYRILKNIRSVSTCIHRNAAIDHNDCLWTWGARSMAKTENGAFSNDLPQDVVYVPQKRMNHVAAVSTGAWHTMCITKDSCLWGWGENECGQLGLGDFQSRPEPTFIMDHVAFVFANETQTFVIKTDQSLWGWGSNENGTLLDAPTYCYTPVCLMQSVQKMCAGPAVAMAICENKTLWAWGRNTHGTIFTKPPYQQYLPTMLMEGVRNIVIPTSEDNGHAFLITEAGDLFSIGISDNCGAMTTWKLRKTIGQTPIKVLEKVKSVYAGNHFTYILLADDRLFAIGANGLGQCGTGTSTNDIKVPKLILSHTTCAAAGHYHGMGLQQNGDLWIWGGDYGLPK